MAKAKSIFADTETGEVVPMPVQVTNLSQPWRTQFNFDPKEDRLKDFGKSLTVPDQSLSMTDILRRYKQGMSLTTHAKEYAGYELEEELPDLRKMDLAEIQALKEQNEQQLYDLRQEMITKEKQKRDLLELQAKEAWFNQETERRAKEAAKKAARDNKPIE